MRFLSTVLFILISFISYGQELTPVSWTYDSESLGNSEFVLTFTADIDKNWNVYSQFTGDDGPVPTEITYESGEFEKLGPALETGHKKEGHDKLFDTNVIKFLDDQPFVIKQKIKLTDPSKPVVGYLTYMTCDSERCLPPTDVEFTFELKEEQKAAAPKVQTEKTSSPVVETTKTIEKVASAVTAAPEQIKKVVDNKTETTKVEAQKKSVTKQVEKVQETAAKLKTPEPQAEVKSQEEVNDDQNKILDPVKWETKIESLGNNEYNLIYIATMEDPWKVYSQFTDPDGPVPTEITYLEKGDVELLGKATEKGHRKEGPDPLFDGATVIKFLSDQTFEITQKIKTNSTDKIVGYLTYMTCNDEGCLPPTDVDFEFGLKEQYAGALRNIGNATTAGMNLDGNVLDQAIPTIKETLDSPIGDCGETGTTEDKSMFWTFIFGFIGGLIALLTPCVFPMIPLTVSFFTKGTKRKGWVNGLIYGASIIVIYVAMGLLLTAAFGPEALNRLSTNWIANSLFFLIFVFFAFSFFGYYEITLPSSWTTKSDTMADKGGFIGIFFMAFTLALVSFSCTGPIIGSALVASAVNPIGPAIVMLGFSLGLAVPFGLFAAFPSWLKSLPQSGGWMNSVKVVLGFLELALAFKFLSVADMTNNWGFLRYELFMVIWVLVFIGMTLYLFGFIKFPHDSPIKKLSPTRWIFALASLAFTIYLATGFIYKEDTNSYNALGLMSGLAPPAHYTYLLKKGEVDADIKAKYPSYTKCANGIECFKDYYQGLAFAKEQDKPVFLDFTGHGCVNCRKVEEHVWVDDVVRNRLKNDFVLISLYVDDDKKLDETYISKSRDKKLRNVGNKWADFQIVNFAQNSQPLYVMMTTDEQVLANPRSYIPNEGIKEYREYMDCGMEALKSLK